MKRLVTMLSLFILMAEGSRAEEGVIGVEVTVSGFCSDEYKATIHAINEETSERYNGPVTKSFRSGQAYFGTLTYPKNTLTLLKVSIEGPGFHRDAAASGVVNPELNPTFMHFDVTCPLVRDLLEEFSVAPILTPILGAVINPQPVPPTQSPFEVAAKDEPEILSEVEMPKPFADLAKPDDPKVLTPEEKKQMMIEVK